MKKIGNGLIFILFVSYPVGIYFGLKFFEPRYLGILVIVILAIRMSLIKNLLNRQNLQNLLPLLVVLIVCGLLGFIFNESSYFKLYPFLINISMLCMFMYSLWRAPSFVERIARLSSPDLPEHAIAYTRKVTMVWCVFFVGNAAMAFWTTYWTDMEIWTLYNGFVSYILIGLIFGVEFIIRQFIMRRYEGHEF